MMLADEDALRNAVRVCANWRPIAVRMMIKAPTIRTGAGADDGGKSVCFYHWRKRA